MSPIPLQPPTLHNGPHSTLFPHAPPAPPPQGSPTESACPSTKEQSERQHASLLRRAYGGQADPLPLCGGEGEIGYRLGQGTDVNSFPYPLFVADSPFFLLSAF